MAPKLSLRQLLVRRMLPTLTGLIIVVAFMLFTITFYFASEEISDNQQASLDGLKRDLSYLTQDTTRQLADLAANDIIINALVDVEQRDNYLPMFFRSLNLTQARDVSFALYDFSGALVIQKNWPEQLPNTLEQAWRPTTLVESESYYSITEYGVLFSVPVLLNEMAEGALVMYVASLQPLLRPYPRLTEQVVTDGNNTVLFSSDLSFVEQGKLRFTQHTTQFLVGSESFGDLKLYSISSFTSAFSSIRWLALVILAMIVGTLLINLHIISITAKQAQDTLTGLYDDIIRRVRNEEKPVSDSVPLEVLELSKIRTSFDELLTNLTEMSLSNEQFSNVIDSMGDMLLVVDNSQTVLLCNRQFDALCDTYSEGHDATIARLITKLHGKSKGELKYTDSKGEASRILWRVQPLLDENNVEKGKIYVGADVTEQKALESRIKILTSAIDEATVSIVISDIKSKGQPVIYANGAFADLTGYSREEILGGNCAMLQGKETESSSVFGLKTAIRNRIPVETTLLNYRKDGTSFFNNLILTPIQIDGEVTHYIGIQQDVTKKLQAERYLQEAKIKAEESARMKSGFLASMSHEIRTPIHGISGILQLLEKTPLNNDQQHYVSLANYSVESLSHIVNDILDFSKIEAGQMQVEAHPFSLIEEINQLENQYRLLCEQKGLSLLFNNQFPTGLRVLGDAVRYRQILTNLLGNAVKFTETGTISVTTNIVESANDQLLLRCDVKDTGIGIAREKQPGIFAVFTQEDLSTTRKFGGTGLGLSICKQLCSLMGGDISLESQKGVGSTFSFYIQLERAPEEQSNGQQNTDQVSSIKTGKLKILVVEDNEINQTIVKEHLTTHKAISAMSGVEALEALNKFKPTFDVILMDCLMPEMDGFEATRRIRNGEAGARYENVPIIALTANAMKGDREACFAAGMNDYLSKPFDVDDLLDKIEYWASVKKVPADHAS